MGFEWVPGLDITPVGLFGLYCRYLEYVVQGIRDPSTMYGQSLLYWGSPSIPRAVYSSLDLELD